MTGQILMINPAPRRNAKGQFIKKAKSAVKKRVAAKPKTTVTVSQNPTKKVKRKKSASAVSKMPVKKRKYKRNPTLKLDLKSIMKSAVMPSMVSSVGAIGLDIAVGFVNEKWLADKPELQSGVMGSAIKFGGAIALGLLANKVKGREFGTQVMVGGMTVTLHNLMRASIQGMTKDDGTPMIPLDGMGVYDSSLNAYDRTLGVYTNGYNGIPGNDLGMYSPALIAGLGDGRGEWSGFNRVSNMNVFQ